VIVLHDFITANSSEIISRTRAMAAARPCPPAVSDEMENGIPLFLDQLSETLRLEASPLPFPPDAIGSTAAMHGRELLGQGFTVSQVVHGYGDVCQAITELAIERKATISSVEFHTLNRCLDDAMAESVAEYGRLKDLVTRYDEAERLGRLAHEMRNSLQTAMLSFQIIKSGRVGIAGSTGAVLGRTLIGLSEMIDNALAEVRLSATLPRRDRVSLLAFVDEIAVAAKLHAQSRDIHLTVEAVDPALDIEVDPQLLASAMMNLLQNAFKYTHPDGHVTIRTRAEQGRVFIEVEDECGGIKQSDDDLFRAFGDRKGSDRSGLGLGLSISQRAVTANGGAIHNRDVPGKGCIFTIELPQAFPTSGGGRGHYLPGREPDRQPRPVAASSGCP
jgi:signal transduction histidine kinase